MPGKYSSTCVKIDHGEKISLMIYGASAKYNRLKITLKIIVLLSQLIKTTFWSSHTSPREINSRVNLKIQALNTSNLSCGAVSLRNQRSIANFRKFNIVCFKYTIYLSYVMNVSKTRLSVSYMIILLLYMSTQLQYQ